MVRTINLSFDADSSESVEVGEIAPGQFRLRETPILAEGAVYLGDLIEAQADERGEYRFQRVIERSGLETHSWIVGRSVAESEELAEFGQRIEALGGHTEQFFGGCLIVHLPPDSPFHVEEELDAISARVASRSSNL